MTVDTSAIRDAAERLRRGELVAFPTETVYGLGADATNLDALARLYAVKQRPPEHPVIVHLGDRTSLDGWARHLSSAARALAAALWPGPLTLVVERGSLVPDEVTGGRATVGLRVPAQPVALELLREFGGGVAAPSANRFGHVSPTTAAAVRADLGDDVGVILDGGPCAVGVESTILDCSGDRLAILRPGGVPRERIEAIAGEPVALRRDLSGSAPGTLKSHYAPAATVLVVDRSDVGVRAAGLVAAGQRVAVLAGGEVPDVPSGVVVLDRPRDVDEYARVLYARLREVDDRGLDVLLAVPPPEVGLGAAVADRLRRAAGVEGHEGAEE